MLQKPMILHSLFFIIPLENVIICTIIPLENVINYMFIR